MNNSFLYDIKIRKNFYINKLLKVNKCFIQNNISLINIFK